jgi:hypothetical protein
VSRAVVHEFLGVAPVEWGLVATDVSAMGPAELAVHAARLRALRATLVRQVLGTTTEKKQGRGPWWSRDRSPRGRRGRRQRKTSRVKKNLSSDYHVRGIDYV